MNDVANLVSVRVSTLHQVIQQITHEDSVERLALALIEELKNLCESYTEKGEVEFSNSIAKNIHPNISYIFGDEGPLCGTYIGLGLGERRQNFGFLAKPVVDFLRIHFAKSSVNPPISSHSAYESRMGPVNASTTIFITDDGTFSIDYTYTWFIGRRVD